YEEAFRIKIAWRNYNLFIDNLVNNIKEYDDNEIRAYAQYLITLSKSQIRLIQKFELTLHRNQFLENVSSTDEHISHYLLDRFFESLNDISSIPSMTINCIRLNYTQQSKDVYTAGSYIPNIIDFDNYLRSYHSTRLEYLSSNEEIRDADSDDILCFYNNLKNRDYDYLSCYYGFPEGKKFSSMKFHYFKYEYYVFIEPVILSLKRFEYSTILNS
ncbi:MAG: hypothetical protein K2H98_09660, partial [Duncaniella sp.]|nr:hypothetical protein [Duncaniella sp.]